MKIKAIYHKNTFRFGNKGLSYTKANANELIEMVMVHLRPDWERNREMGLEIFEHYHNIGRSEDNSTNEDYINRCQNLDNLLTSVQNEINEGKR